MITAEDACVQAQRLISILIVERKSRGRPRTEDVPALGPLAARYGEAIRRLREAAGLSQTELARAVALEMGKLEHEFHPTTLAKVERGTRPTPLDEAAAIARIFGLSLDRLVVDPSASNHESAGRQQRLLLATSELHEAQRELHAATLTVVDANKKRVAAQTRAKKAAREVERAQTRLDEWMERHGQHLET